MVLVVSIEQPSTATGNTPDYNHYGNTDELVRVKREFKLFSLDCPTLGDYVLNWNKLIAHNQRPWFQFISTSPAQFY